MKKLLSFVLAATFAAAPVAARELQFYNGEEPVESGSRLVFTEISSTSIGNGMVEVVFDPKLYLWSDIFTNTVSLTADCISDQYIQLCAGGECVSGKTVTKENLKISSNQKLFLQFEYMSELPEDEDIPEVVTEFSAYDTKYEDIKANITVVMNPSAGVGTMFVNDSSFKAVAGGIEYDFAVPTEVIIYTLNGEALYTSVKEGSGTIDTSNFPAGIYLYHAGDKGGKIYLR